MKNKIELKLELDNDIIEWFKKQPYKQQSTLSKKINQWLHIYKQTHQSKEKTNGSKLENPNKLLLQYLSESEKILDAHSQNIISFADNTTIRGNCREALIGYFLSKNMPQAIEFNTGEVFDSNGRKSGQCDIVLTLNTSPKLNLYDSSNLFPCETILGVIEVKSSLESNDVLSKVIEHCKKLKSLKRIGSNRETRLKLLGDIHLSTIPYIVFSYKTMEISTIKETMDFRCGVDTPDLFVSLDKGTSLFKRFNNGNLEYKKFDNSLLSLYIVLLGLVEDWSKNPHNYYFPLEEYIKDTSDLKKLFSDSKD